MPVVDLAAAKRIARLFRAERIARRMAGAAMGQSLDQIGAAIPFRWFGGVGLITAMAQEQQLPARDHGALIERK